MLQSRLRILAQAHFIPTINCQLHSRPLASTSDTSNRRARMRDPLLSNGNDGEKYATSYSEQSGQIGRKRCAS